VPELCPGATKMGKTREREALGREALGARLPIRLALILPFAPILFDAVGEPALTGIRVPMVIADGIDLGAQRCHRAETEHSHESH